MNEELLGPRILQKRGICCNGIVLILSRSMRGMQGSCILLPLAETLQALAFLSSFFILTKLPMESLR